MKIISFADMHLDSQFVNYSETERASRRELLAHVFLKICSVVKSENADVLLIAGDLFDIPNPSNDAVKLVSDELSSVSIPVFIVPGNHDYYIPGGVYDEMPSNVFVFKDEKISTVYIDSLSLAVSGYAFLSESHMNNPINEFKPAKEAETHILLAHTALQASAEYAPFDLQKLSGTDLKFAFLGHVHKDSETYSSGSVKAAFSGIPQGRSIDETVNGGVRVVEIENGEIIRNDIISVAVWSNIIAETDADGILSDAKLVQRIQNELKLVSPAKNDVVRVVVKGEHDISYSPNIKFIESTLKDEFPGVALSVKNQSEPHIEHEDFMKDPTIVGILYRLLVAGDTYSGEYDYETRLRAFKLAVNAVRGNNINSDTV